MGRKSKAKKIVREIIQENEQIDSKKKEKSKSKAKKRKLKEKIKKDIKKKGGEEVKKKFQQKKKIKKETKEKKQKKKSEKQIYLTAQIFGVIVASISAGLLALISVLALNFLLKTPSVAEFLPKDSTVFFWEIDQTLANENERELIKKLPYFEDYKTVLGSKIGIAGIKNKEGELETVYFSSITDEDQQVALQKTIKGSMKLASWQKNKKYIFFSESKESMDLIKDDGEKISKSSTFIRVNNNLPRRRVSFLFINIAGNRESIANTFLEITKSTLNPFLAQMILEPIKSEGAVVVNVDGRLAIQSFTDRFAISNSKNLKTHAKYNAKLLSYVSADEEMIFGGWNMHNQLTSLLDFYTIDQSSEAENMVEKALSGYIKKYFGKDTKYEKQVKELLEREFLFAIEKNEQDFNYELLIDLGGEKAVANKYIKLIAEDFAKTNISYKEKLITHTLLDGTKGQEIIAVPEQAEFKEIKYESNTIYSLEKNDKPANIYYSTKNDILLISNNVEKVKKSLDLIKNSDNSLKNAEMYSEIILPILQSSDELLYMNTMGKDVFGVQQFAMGNNYFNDGISSIALFDFGKNNAE